MYVVELIIHYITHSGNRRGNCDILLNWVHSSLVALRNCLRARVNAPAGFGYIFTNVFKRSGYLCDLEYPLYSCMCSRHGCVISTPPFSCCVCWGPSQVNMSNRPSQRDFPTVSTWEGRPCSPGYIISSGTAHSPYRSMDPCWRFFVSIFRVVAYSEKNMDRKT
jgi:hypothetical protein